ncbi:DUF748 domain-containing protein [Reichenbachiella carrageenanivorans]|uniref:DUF748 domain-containing protein n=1 Tax=Reichenbachiella carrageenanivorans TaxID=2979869 RepID=A0ABY6D2J9_9BACT|nr:DUF748 domain-containing protein [Reichenbachiella carrageenanivorans]UXX80384.1 DUF748 domain-containing protein [Reichenbachiella carrageenanivorans]
MIALVLIAIALIILPIIVRQVAIKNSEKWIGRSIDIDDIDINLFTSTVEIFDLKVYEPDGATVFVGLDTLLVDLELYRLMNHEFVLEQLYLAGSTISVIKSDSSFNFDDIVAHFESSDTTEIEVPIDTAVQTEESGMAIILSNMELKDALFTLQERGTEEVMELKNINFFVPFIALNQANSSEAGLKFDFTNGGYFQSQVDFNPKTSDFEAHVMIHDLAIGGYEKFLTKYITLGKLDGAIDLALNVTGNINAVEQVDINGRFGLQHFVLEDVGALPLVKFDNLKVTLTEADLATNRFVVDSVILTKPTIHFELFDSSNNFVEFLAHAMPTDTTIQEKEVVVEPVVVDSIATPAAPVYYTIHTIRVEDGVLEYTDSRTGDEFVYHLNQMQLAVDTVDSETHWVVAQANMVLNDRGKLVAELGIDPTNPMDLTLDYTISDFMLSDLNIYSRYYMGFPILYGDMYYKSHTEIKNHQLVSENKLIIRHVELGNKTKGLHDLPLKLALFLLKDKEGVITLDVPLKGNLDDPDVSVGKIVWKTLNNLIFKVVAAPGKMLVGFVGGNPQDLKEIKYDYMDSTFSDKKKKQLDLLITLETKKPELSIDLVYYNDVQLEKEAIARDRVGSDFNKKTGQNYKRDQEAFEQYVIGRLGRDTLSVSESCLLIMDKATVDTIYTKYNQFRYESLSQYLKATSDSTNIKLHIAKETEPKNIGSRPIFEVKYGLKEED